MKAAPMRRNSTMAVLLSVPDVDHAEKYNRPPEDSGAFREAAAVTSFDHVFPGVAHVDHWEKYEPPLDDGGDFREAAAVTSSDHVFPRAAHVNHWEKYERLPEEGGDFREAVAVTNCDHVFPGAAHVDHCEKYEPPAEEGGAFREAAAVTSHDHYFPVAAHVDEWEEQEPYRSGAFREAVTVRSHVVDVSPGTAHFLQLCFLCSRPMKPHMKIYMYRDAAYCTAECRRMQIEIDESDGNCSAGTAEALWSSVPCYMSEARHNRDRRKTLPPDSMIMEENND